MTLKYKMKILNHFIMIAIIMLPFLCVATDSKPMANNDKEANYQKNVDPSIIGKFNNWYLYKGDNDGSDIYFLTSIPTKKYGNYTNRSSAKIWVTNNNDNDEVSVYAGYKYKKDKYVDMVILGKIDGETDKILDQIYTEAEKGNCSLSELKNNGNHYNFNIIEDEQAWLDNNQADDLVIKDFRKNYYAIVAAYSQKGTCSVDLYSLLGFIKGYNTMKKYINN
ncbi:MAG: hypothetical protein OEY79_04500 [Anaplasmataceae bacterium]|nr:hypothetical protein [Anaplasmataceae bacterium]